MMRITIRLIRWYQRRCSKYTPHCRYHPTCSQYMIDAILRYGTIYGLFIGTLRLVRCNKRCRQSGYDPVPHHNAIRICVNKTIDFLGDSWKIDVSTLTACSLLYLLNRLYGKNIGLYFLDCYFNDVCCGAWFMSCTNLLLWFRKRRIEKLQYILIYIGSWGIYWEVTGSSLRATAVADKYDIAAYCAGSILYWTLNAVVARVHTRDESRNT